MHDVLGSDRQTGAGLTVEDDLERAGRRPAARDLELDERRRNPEAGVGGRGQRAGREGGEQRDRAGDRGGSPAEGFAGLRLIGRPQFDAVNVTTPPV
ncbi:MAG: hypothetical protein Q8K79_07180 [Solirubrobacteraceae bacterium]|nr:hypothetical protein [Solirubrobacteraceae bacterium]